MNLEYFVEVLRINDELKGFNVVCMKRADLYSSGNQWQRIRVSP